MALLGQLRKWTSALRPHNGHRPPVAVAAKRTQLGDNTGRCCADRRAPDFKGFVDIQANKRPTFTCLARL